MKSLNLYPSILDASPDKFMEMLNIFKCNSIKGLHIDVMDGNYVPSYGFNDRFIKWISNNTDFYQDVHLMVSNPEDVVDLFVKAGSNGITVHYNTAKDLYYLLNYLNGSDVNSGVAINPSEDPRLIIDILPIVHHVLVMTSNPGRPSNGSIISMNKKIIWLNQFRIDHKLNFRIQVDGGITAQNIDEFLQAGCDDFVSGGYITKANDIDLHIKELKSILK